MSRRLEQVGAVLPDELNSLPKKQIYCSRNALKLIYCNVDFPIFSGGRAPRTLLKGKVSGREGNPINFMSRQQYEQFRTTKALEQKPIYCSRNAQKFTYSNI